MIVDVSDWKPDLPFDGCIMMCVSLGLIEVFTHHGEEHTRLTQRGVNVMLTLTLIAGQAQKKNAKPQPN